MDPAVVKLFFVSLYIYILFPGQKRKMDTKGIYIKYVWFCFCLSQINFIPVSKYKRCLVNLYHLLSKRWLNVMSFPLNQHQVMCPLL